MNAALKAAQAAAVKHMQGQTHSGTYLAEGATSPVDCSVSVGMESREIGQGGVRRIKTATVIVAKCALADPPADQEKVKITLDDGEGEFFRVMEHHDQIAEHWLIRLAQWGS